MKMLQVFKFGLDTIDNFWEVLSDYYPNDMEKYDDALDEIDSIIMEMSKNG